MSIRVARAAMLLSTRSATECTKSYPRFLRDVMSRRADGMTSRTVRRGSFVIRYDGNDEWRAKTTGLVPAGPCVHEAPSSREHWARAGSPSRIAPAWCAFPAASSGSSGSAGHSSCAASTRGLRRRMLLAWMSRARGHSKVEYDLVAPEDRGEPRTRQAQGPGTCSARLEVAPCLGT